jgi:hypothetical protein
MVENRFSPATPRAALRGMRLTWAAVPGATQYVVYRNGVAATRTAGTSTPVRAPGALDEYQVLAINGNGDESFLSEPVRVVSRDAEQVVKPEGDTFEREHAGYTGEGYVRITTDRNISLTMPVQVSRAGWYAIDVRYANGNGPVNTDDKVAVRTLVVDADTAGVVVMPQRGANRWSDWGWSNALRVQLTPGAHTITIAYTLYDENMNRRENTALLDQVRLTRLR